VRLAAAGDYDISSKALPEKIMSGGDSKRNTIIAVIAVAVIVGAGLRIVHGLRSGSALVPMPAFAEAGRVLAKETAGLVNGAGKVVVWQLELQSDSNPLLQASAKAFAKTLKQTRGVVVTATEHDSLNPWDPEGWKHTALEPARFAALIEKHRQADVLVLLGELPRLTAEDCRQLPTPRPKIVALALLGTPAPCLWEQKVVQVVILPKTQAQPEPTLPKTPAEWFARMYTIIKADNSTGGS
jgi:hypothetical protein